MVRRQTPARAGIGALAALLLMFGDTGTAAAQSGPRAVIGIGANGASKTWTLSDDRAFLAVPYAGDELGGAVASVEVGAMLGVALFQRPFFASRDLGCAPEIGSDSRLDLLWLGATARFEPGPAIRTEDSAPLPDPATGGFGSLILYRKELGPPPGVLILDRRRTLGSKCRSALHKTTFNRIFVPISDAPEGPRCFDLVGRYRPDGGPELSLDFGASDSAVLLTPANLDPAYGKTNVITATLYSQAGCGGSAINLESAAAATPETRLNDFGFRDLVRSVLVRYDAGPFLAYLPAPEASVPGTAVAARAAPQDASHAALQELERRTAAAPEMPAPAVPAPKVEAQPAPEPAPAPAAKSTPDPASQMPATAKAVPVPAVESSPTGSAAGPQAPAPAPPPAQAAPASRPGEVQQALPKLTPEIVPAPSSTPPPPGADKETFNFPVQDVYRLNYCLNWGADCGAPAANAWCQAQGFARASDFEADKNIGGLFPTVVMGSGRICASFLCDGFTAITCSQ